MNSQTTKKNSFIKDFLRNLGLLILIGIILMIAFPDQMRQVFQLYGALFGPAIVILLIIVAALPRRRR